MKAIRLEQPWDIACVDTEMSVPAEGEALIKIKAAGIGGGDIGAYRGTSRLASYPRILGSQLAGEIISIPANNKSGLVSGDRVIINPYIFCGDCYPCSIGRTNCCTDLKVIGNHVEGGMAEYFCHPADLLKKIPDELSWEEAALVDPLAFALHGIHRGRLEAGEYCVIAGSGSRGLMASIVVLAMGGHPIVIDYVSERLEYAKALGVTYVINPDDEDEHERIKEITSGNMAQMVIVCSNDDFMVRKSVEYVSYAGRVVIAGWSEEKLPVSTAIIAQKELDIMGSRTCVDEYEEAIDMLLSGKIDLLKTISKRVSITEAADTIMDMEQHAQDYMNVIISMDM